MSLDKGFSNVFISMDTEVVSVIIGIIALLCFIVSEVVGNLPPEKVKSNSLLELLGVVASVVGGLLSPRPPVSP